MNLLGEEIEVKEEKSNLDFEKGHRRRMNGSRGEKRVEKRPEGREKKKKSDQLDANEMSMVPARDIWGGLTRRALL